MARTVDDILEPKPKARPRIYAYAIDDAAHAGLLKVGQTTRDVRARVGEQLRTAFIENFRIEHFRPALVQTKGSRYVQADNQPKKQNILYSLRWQYLLE